MAIPRLPSYRLPDPSTFPESKAPWELDWRRAALLIHDVQLYFLSFYGEGSPLVAELLERIARLKRLCKERGAPVFYTAQPVGQKPEQRGLLNDMWGRGIDNRPELRAIAPELRPDDADRVLDKWRYSAFERSDLEERLAAADRDQLLICGIYGHIGCLMTAAGAFMRDVQPFVVGDAIADFSLEDHAMTLRYVATRCGKVVSLDALERT